MSLLWVATLRAESWALIRVLRSARLRHVSLTWLLSPLLARDTSDRPAVIFQPSDSYTCGAIPLEHGHVSSQPCPGGQWLGLSQLFYYICLLFYSRFLTNCPYYSFKMALLFSYYSQNMGMSCTCTEHR